jgi:integrase
MARKNTGPRYFESKGGYFCTINGERHCLAKGPEDDSEVREVADRRYHELMLVSPGTLEGDRATCEEIFSRYIAAVRNHRKPSTIEVWQRIYNAFGADLKKTKARDLKPWMVTAWLAKMEEDRPHPTHGTTRWNSGTRFIALTALKAAFNWAVEQEILSRNPIAKLKKPRARSRGGDQLLDAAGHEKLMKAAHPRLKDFLQALHDTGARPGEITRITSTDFNPEIGAWVLSDHKTQRFGRKRVIYLTPSLVDLTKRLATKHTDGPLFRNRCGRPWTLKTLEMAFLRLRRQLDLKKVSPYSYRHLFATQFLLKGGSIAVLAELMGDTIATVEHHYGHIREHGPQLRQFLLEFREERLPDHYEG